MNDEEVKNGIIPEEPVKAPEETGAEEPLALDSSERVKVLSPGMMVFRRFVRNKLAIAGAVILLFMFLFSFAGPLFSPYSPTYVFHEYRENNAVYATAGNKTAYDLIPYGDFKTTEFSSLFGAHLTSTFITELENTDVITKTDNYTSGSGKTFKYYKQTDNIFILYEVVEGDEELRLLATNFVIDGGTAGQSISAGLRFEMLFNCVAASASFIYGGTVYDLIYDGAVNTYSVFAGEAKELFCRVTTFSVRFNGADIFTVDYKDAVYNAALHMRDGGLREYAFDYDTIIEGYDGEETVETVEHRVYLNSGLYTIRTYQLKYEIDRYSPPNKKHLLGTDSNGMDVLTRMMYGGRVTLLVAFIVIIVETVLGVIMGGIAGYFGKWVDGLIMRLVDIFNCLPFLPVVVILAALFDKLGLDSWSRLMWLMALLGFLGWAGVARLVRGQILSLREQDFMVAAEAAGLRPRRRIFRHLIPNVMPQLIVTATMGLGSIIIVESTLSFLGLGAKYPMATWGAMIDSISSIEQLRNHMYIWMPIGLFISLTVIAFNFAGDGLRDAFDPKMKR